MSEDLYANTTKTVKFEKNEQEDGIVDMYVSADNLNVYDHQTERTTETTYSTADDHPGFKDINKWNVETKQLRMNYNNLTLERDQLQTSYNNLTEEKKQLLTNYNMYKKTVKFERDEQEDGIVDMYVNADNLDVYDHPQIEKTAETTETTHSTADEHPVEITPEKRRSKVAALCMCLLSLILMAVATGLVVRRFKDINCNVKKKQLQMNYNNLTLERDQLQTSYNNLTEEKNNLTLERDQLQTSYNNLTEEKNNLTLERDQLQTSYNALMEVVKTACNDPFPKQNRLQNNTLASIDCPEGWRRFGCSCYYLSPDTEQKNWSQSRQDCQNRGYDLVVINSQEEMEFVRSLQKLVWVGLSEQKRNWIWVDGTTQTEGWGGNPPHGHTVRSGSPPSSHWEAQNLESRNLGSRNLIRVGSWKWTFGSSSGHCT
ncbi:uncharacterized protein ACJ7VT_018544 [Polymixia lowei]